MAQITADLLKAAGDYAAQQYNDQWLGVEAVEGEPSEDPGTVVVSYQGRLFEVCLLSRLLGTED